MLYLLVLNVRCCVIILGMFKWGPNKDFMGWKSRGRGSSDFYQNPEGDLFLLDRIAKGFLILNLITLIAFQTLRF